MIEKKKCENNHKMVVNWGEGHISETVCTNDATRYKIDSFGIFYLCDECYEDDCKRAINSETMTLKKKSV